MSPGSGIGNPKILVTRAPEGASRLAEELRSHGLEPVLIPAIATQIPASFAALDAAIGSLSNFDWIVFTSAAAVAALSERMRQLGKPARLPETLRVAAVGPATALAAGELGRVDLVPGTAVAEALAADLLPYARGRDGTPARFLLVRAEQARDVLPDTLRSAGAELTIAPAYRTVVPAGSVELLRQLFLDPENSPAAITFTSSSAVRNLLSLCEAAGVTLPADALRISIGPITSETLREAGLPPHAEASEANVAALADEVGKALQESRSRHSG